MKLALCVIVEGDVKLKPLQTLLASCDGVVDSVHITVNQKPHIKVKRLCEKKGYDFSYLPWSDNFSTQRNYNFSRVPEDTDYIVWADSDDVLINAYLLRDIARVSKQSGYDTVFFEYWYGAKFNGTPSLETFVEKELTQNRERLIRPGSIMWHKRIHETPVPLDDPNFKYSRVAYSPEYPIAWLHLGADRDLSKEAMDRRMERNRRLLEMELADEREHGGADPRTLLYLMKIYAETADAALLQKCLSMGEEYLSKSGWDQERAVCYELMSRCLGTIGDHAGAKDLLHLAIGEYPHNPLLYLRLAKSYFNLGNYPSMKHWMKIGLSMDLKDDANSMKNILDAKVTGAALMLQYYLHVDKDIRKAYEAAKKLNIINPTLENQSNEDYLHDQAELDIACEGVHKLMQYYVSVQREDLIGPLYDSLMPEIKRLPFANKFNNRYKTPRVWGDKEICYYANFGGDHFERWDGNSVKKGIGGSETAVIRLAEEWTKLGYTVTVYGDPLVEKTINGVIYKPWYAFNGRDKFNIFIQWRNSGLARKINAKRLYVDLHDVFHESSHMNRLQQIDKIFVKSKFHRDYAPSIPDGKMEVLSNGI